jgi:hypothetical protein
MVNRTRNAWNEAALAAQIPLHAPWTYDTPMRRRTVIITLLLILSGGAIVNIAVAWGVWRLRDLSKVAEVEIEATAPLQLRSAIIDVFEGRDLDQEHESAWHGRIIGADGFSFTWLGTPVESTDVYASWLRYGLPFRAVEGGSFVLVGGDQHMSEFTVASLELSDALRRRWFTADICFLPAQPVWHGMILNTLVYALLLWLLFLAPFTARRMIRRRRGLCETCAYPVGVSSVCTECGAALHCSMKASQT